MKTITKSPVKNGIANVPVIMQMESQECGAACLTMVMAFYGKWIPLEKVRFDCGVSRDGVRAKDMLVAARNFGFEASGYGFNVEELVNNHVFPQIAYWNNNHFVVLKGLTKSHAYINDPARGELKITMEEFEEAYSGVCLQIIPGNDFEPSGRKKSIMAFAFNRLKNAKGEVIFVALITMISYMIEVFNPVMSKVFMDRILSGKNSSWLRPFIYLMLLFALLQILTDMISKVYALRINGKLSATSNTSFMWKIFNLPMEFFSQRMAGDIITRQKTNERISETLVDTIAPLLFNTAMTVVYLVFMLKYSVLLTFVGLTAMVLNLVTAKLISERRINITRVLMRDTGKLLSATLSGINMTETIKASGSENGFFQRWAGLQASVNAQNAKYQKLENYLGIIPMLLTSLLNHIVLIIGVYLTMHGQFTLGMIMSFQGFMQSFMTPAMGLVQAGQAIQEMRTDMERIEDVFEYKDDYFAKEKEVSSDEDFKKLSGNIEIKNVSFGYSRLDEPEIKDFSLSVKAGMKIALVGASGCGKSTISKLLAGLYEPWSGEITYDGKKISDIDRNRFKGSVAVVDQEIILFEDTIENNIKMWDETIEDFEVILACRDAGIHDTIMKKPGDYRYKLLDGGRDLSGGEKQRIEIARVLAQDPSIIILDEATSALDAKTEYDVIKAIKQRGITTIIIAHRLSTIRDCDQIIVIDNGEIVERGTHEELLSRNGYYTKLVAVE